MAETCKKASAILVFWNGICYNKSKYGFLYPKSQEEIIWKYLLPLRYFLFFPE